MPNTDDLATDIARILDELRAGMENPVWTPLEALLPMEWCGGFMFMGAPEVGIYNAGTIKRDATGAPDFTSCPRMRMFLYKHGITRRYLNIGEDLNCYEYRSALCDVGDPIYSLLPTEVAIARPFADLAELGATRTTVYNDDYIAARNARLVAAGFRVIS
jgi:hypothetical protein